MPEKRIEYLSMKSKVKIAEEVVNEAYERFHRFAIVFSGGKDSTVMLDLVSKYASKNNVPMPPVLFIDHGLHFSETWDFLNLASNFWKINIMVAKNENVLSNVINGNIEVDKLNSDNKKELRVLNYSNDTIPYSLHTEVANHLLKTVAMNSAIEENRFEALFVGVRWDENEARSSEVFLSSRDKPFHYRLHPILTFTERDIWDYIIQNKLPKHPLYERGFRSIDGKEDSTPLSNLPAWEQDLSSTSERAGRSQDKEGMMDRLRKLGYM
jgi:phosphoadenosine phosphosulfate reductase